MSDIGTPMSTPIPAVGSSGTAYATGINAFLTEVQNRLESLLPKTSLGDGDLDMNGYSVQNAAYLGLADADEVPTTPINTFQMHNGEVYWVSVDGAVQLTSGGVINAASIGGITGDYGSPNPAEFRFVDLDETYYAYDDFGGGAWARLWARSMDIANGSTGAERVRLQFDGPSSYALTLPDAVPGATQALRMDATGSVEPFTGFTRTMVIPVTPGMERISGSPNVKDWDYTYNSSSFAYMVSTNISGAHFSLFIPIVVPRGCTITNVSVRWEKTTSSATTLKAELWKNIDGASTSLSSSTDAGNATGLNLVSLNVSETTSTNKSYVLEVRRSVGTGTGDKVYYASVTYNEPLTIY